MQKPTFYLEPNFVHIFITRRPWHRDENTLCIHSISYHYFVVYYLTNCLSFDTQLFWTSLQSFLYSSIYSTGTLDSFRRGVFELDHRVSVQAKTYRIQITTYSNKHKFIIKQLLRCTITIHILTVIATEILNRVWIHRQMDLSQIP